jgi:cyanate permease
VRTGLTLAMALVKVARLTPPQTPMGLITSPLVGGGAIEPRVRRLLEYTPAKAHGWRQTIRRWALFAAVLSTLAWMYSPLLEHMHEVTEKIIPLLP